ncbi:small conductance calcium-activated potassium channel [Aureococcus anophagefferens]|nr:small conductance calcium-activated potassium channel [Aureococcus anophagefferens]
MASAARGVKQKDGVPTAGAVTMIMQAHEVEKRAHEPIKGSPMDRAEYLTWVLLLMDILSVVVSVASVEAGWNGVNYARTGLTDGLRGLLCCLSGVSAGVICRRYYILADESDPEYDVDHRPDGLIFVVELLMRLFVIPPGVEAVFRVGGVQHYADRYPVSNLNTAVFLRLYTIVHYSMLQSIYDDDHVVAVARMNMVRNDTAFVCKCLFRGAPSRIILFWMLMILLWGTVNLRTYFHGVGDGVPNWTNAVWCIYVSMTSVGYGDYYPKTHLGRLTVGVCVLAYTVLLSLLIGFFSEAVCMDSGQTKVYEYAHSDKYYKKMQSTAAALSPRRAYNDIRERSAPSNIESNLMTVVSMLHDQNDSHSVLAAELKHISECMELIQGRVDRMEAGFKETGEMEKERKGLAVFKKKEKGNLASDAYIHRMIHRVKLKRAANAVKQFQIQSTVPKLKNTTDSREWGVRSAPENYEKRKKSVHQLRLSSRSSVIRRPSQANGGAASAAVAYLGGGGGGGRVAPAGEAKEDGDVVRAFDA